MNYKVELDQVLKKLEDIELALNESSIVAITDRRGIIQFANEKFCNMSKYCREELIGSNQNIVNSGYHSREFMKDLWRTIGTGHVWKGEIKNQAKDGTYYWVDTTIVPFLDEKGKPYQYIAIRHDITKRKEYEKKIELMAYYDTLTSLPNRNMLSKWLDELPQEKREKISILFLDLDRFKSINDNYGHSVGDLVLQETAIRLQKCIRETDFVSRQGGDEFIIILNDIENKEAVRSVVKKIIQEISQPYFIHNNVLNTTTSIGISLSAGKDQNIATDKFIETLITQADTAMYHAKQNGGNRYCFNNIHQNDEKERFYKIEYELKHALELNQFSVVYQPLINLKSNEINGVEALLRWNNPNLGEVSPGEFIPILEELGSIIPVGEWVLRTVCDQMNLWHEEGLIIPRMSVNVSPIQFKDNKFTTRVKNILRESRLPAKFLELEITEGTILNIEEATKTIDQLKAIGVTISIDDFGTGYSSLSYLKRLPIDTLKIDQTFIRNLDKDGEVIVNTVIHMAKNLNFNVIAEGVETAEQLSYLKKQQCNEGQGYYFSRPISGEGLYNFILQNRLLKIVN